MTINVKIEHTNETVPRNIIVSVLEGTRLVESLPIGPGQQRTITLYGNRTIKVREEE